MPIRHKKFFILALIALVILPGVAACTVSLPSVTVSLSQPAASTTTTATTTSTKAPAVTTTATPSATATDTPAVDPRVPASEVDIYNKTFDWPPKDPADWVMSPTVIGFGWNLDHDPDRAAWLHQWGARFISEVSLWNHDGWVTVDDLPPEMADAYVTDVAGHPVYSQDMLYLNLMHPAFRQWLKDDITFQLDHGADGFVFDETAGASGAPGMGAGLDEYSLAGFGVYLAAKYSPDELAGLGVTATAGFDYRAFLEGKGLLDSYARGGYRDLPLGMDYYTYLYDASQDFVTELIDYARQYAAALGRDVLVTANFNPLYDPYLSPIADKLNYYTFEHAYVDPGWRADAPYKEKPGGYPVGPLVRYARTLGQDAVVLPVISDYGTLEGIGEPVATRLVLHSFAETYANLGYFCYFDLDYGFIGNTYAADHTRLRPYYAFLREHPELFNGLTYQAHVAVVAPPRVTQDDYGPVDGVEGVSWILDDMHVDYDVTDMSHPVDGYDLLIVQGYAWSDAEVAKLLDYVKAGGNVIAIDSRFAGLDEQFQPVERPELTPLKTDGRHELGDGSFTFFTDWLGWKYFAMFDQNTYDQLSAAIAANAAANTAPNGVVVIPYEADGRLVVHILNDNFDGSDYTRLSDLAITILLPEGFDLTGDSLTVLSPDTDEPVEIPFVRDGDTLSFTLPSLYIWSAVTSG